MTDLTMLSRSQEKLLRFLGTFPEALAEAWDVPRAVSLPGLSEAMGVVRSGLNQPLNALLDEKMIIVRVAHVLGGGSRRRQVYHITEKGRQWLAEHPEDEPHDVLGDESSPRFTIVGRVDELASLDKLLDDHGHAVVGGLSGVGKTTLLRAWASKQGDAKVRWATVNELSDAQSLLSAWISDTALRLNDVGAMVEQLGLEGPTTLVVDDLHLLDQRHMDQVVHVLNALLANDHKVVLAGRLPLPEAFDWPLLKLGTLPPEQAKSLLGEHLSDDVRLDVAKALDGHPMALNLYQEGDPLPEAGADIQAFVEQTMLSGLDDAALGAMDGMVLFPRPLPSEIVPGADAIGELDERALLRWSDGESSVEVQHLIRNVRRTMLDEERLLMLHQAAADHWANHLDQPAYAVLHLYHTMALGDDRFAENMADRFDRLMLDQSGAMAVIFERATAQRPEHEKLHYWAGRIALHRQETDRVQHHVDNVHDPSMKNELRYELARLEGLHDEAERILQDQFEHATGVDGVRWLLRTTVQRIEDRLFDENIAVDTGSIQTMLNKIQLPEGLDARARITVSMTLVQHSIALLEKDEAKANSLVESLEALSHERDPIVLHARLKGALAFERESEQELRRAYERAVAAQTSPFHAAIVGLTYVEHLVKHGLDAASSVHATLPSPDAWTEGGAPGQRYAARWWYLKGHLDPSVAPMALREASHCYRQAGCTGAARAVMQRLHRVL